MRMTPAELVAHHEPGLAIEGTRVTVTFGDQAVARAFLDGIFQAGERRRAPEDPTRMIGKRLDSLTLQTGQPLEGWADLFLADGYGHAHHFILDPSDLANVADAVRGGGAVSADAARENDALHCRISRLEQECARLREPAGRPDLRDMGATLVDKARARLLDAQAAKLEAETRDRHGPPPGDGRSPVQVEGWKVGGRSDLGTVHATLFDREDRGFELTLLPAQVRELAEALFSGAGFAETGREH